MTQCGYVAIVGRPNVGKSTWLNTMVGQKIAAIVNKVQTTRTNLRGIITEDDTQIIFTDTPGIHLRSPHLLNRSLNMEALAATEGVDAILMIVEAGKWTDEDDHVIQRLQQQNREGVGLPPVILALNKIDRIENKQSLIAHLQTAAEKFPFAELVPVSANKKNDRKILLNALAKYVPEAPFMFAEDEITDQSTRFICGELIREQIMLQLHEEVPYGVAVQIEEFRVTKRTTFIDAIIWVDKKSIKGMIIGKQGQTLKLIGQSARASLEDFLQHKVMLNTFVKVEENWQNDPNKLQQWGMLSD